MSQVVLDVTPPLLGRLIVEGTLVINASSHVNLSATWIELKGGSLIIAEVDSDGNVIGPFTGYTEITIAGNNPRLAVNAGHGDNPRDVPELLLGREGVQVGSGVLGVMGKLVAKGQPANKSWVDLAHGASVGDTTITVHELVDWKNGSEIVITPSDFDMHEAEVRRATGVRWDRLMMKSTISLDSPLAYDHYSGPVESYGTRSIQMKSKVGLLSHNIVIRGQGQGEDHDYREWNSQKPGAASAAVDGNGICENGETSLTTPDCKGPAEEYGAGILVAGYTEDFTDCTQAEECTTGYRRAFEGSVDLEGVELRYFGQNNLRPGIAFENVQSVNSTLRAVSFNRGYFQAVTFKEASGVTMEDCVMYRSHLPTLEILGNTSSRNIIEHNLGVVAIFWNTHRGAKQVRKCSSRSVGVVLADQSGA